ncbi:hypothetical protein AXA56_12130 [Escherichia coli]|nr:hypothetical protein AXA56_12130 [Escherichia coli]
MNKIYKVIWNHTTQKWDVVSELTSCRKKCKSTRLGIALSAMVLGALLQLIAITQWQISYCHQTGVRVRITRVLGLQQ